MRICPATYPARAAVLLAAMLALAGCGSDKRQDDRAQGDTLTIYTSLPRHGVSARAAEAVAAGERLALADRRGRAGGRKVRLVELDDSAPTGSTWDPSAVQSNAKRAASDPTTIAYIGELDFGGSAISVPVTNSKGILQVSPEDGLTSLTQVQPGSFKTSPVRYYPNGRRTFVRLVPTDLEQVESLLSWMRERGARHIALVHDDSLTGRELSAQALARAPAHGLLVDRAEEARSGAASYAGVAAKVVSENPDTVVYLGVGGPSAAMVLQTLAQALPGAPIYGSKGVADATPAASGRLPTVDLLDPILPAREYGGQARRVLARLSAETGAQPPADGLYGYEAMRLVLDAIDATRGDAADRTKVAAAALTPRTRRSVIGVYAVTRSGDVSNKRFGAYRLADGRLVFTGTRDAHAAR